VTIASFNFGESQILANIYADVLNKAGYQATVKSLTNREVVEPALQQGQVNIVPEYLSTLTEFLNNKVNGATAMPLASSDVTKTLAALQKIANPLGITALTPSPATDENAFAVTQEFATANNLTTLSDLATYSQTHAITLGGPPECATRPFCEPGLKKTYGMKFAAFTSLDSGGPLTKQALSQGKIQVGLVFSSDGGINALKLKVLTDDKALQNADNIVPVVQTSLVSADLTRILNAVSAAMTTTELVNLNKSVDIDRADPAQVASDWLASKGLN
jgi:osmoprotectant transport system substrate-binding protein